MNTNLKRFAALGIAGTVVAAPTAFFLAPAAHADVERHGSCGAGTYEFDVDRENGGFEVNFDLDRVKRGSTWKIVLRHDGNRFYKSVRTADHEGDVDVERFRRNTAGSDTFKARAVNTKNGASCSATITVR